MRLPPSYRIVFTSGGSESNNLFIKGSCSPDKKVACLGLEHPSIAETLDYLKLPLMVCPQSEGRIDLACIPQLKENKVRLLCLSHVNNEIGSVNDPGEVLRALENGPTRLFVDGVQAVGRLVLSPSQWQGVVAGYSVSAHKIHGPKGIGLLFYDSKVDLIPQIHGGKQQYGVRSGTLAPALILGLAHAIKLATEQVDETQTHLRKLRNRLIGGLRDLSTSLPNLNIRFNSSVVDDPALQSPAIVNFSFSPVEGEVMLHHLEEKDIYVGLGSACSAHSKQPSKILTGIGLSKEEARCSLRVSFSRHNTPEEIDVFLNEFSRAYESLYPTFCSAVSR
ncbi:MAG: cysteine desulfurase [Nitrospinae bacterium RIFCSPLOWO2_12_FULL_47_7]|nr:MAG: cysteine desulfurase [Nitrospinae bacterium RIFCSPLOWO2_12_FULL_47_7]